MHLIPYRGQNVSHAYAQNLVWRDGSVFIMDNHRAAAWCWAQVVPPRDDFSIFHIDRHTDLLQSRLAAWCAASAHGMKPRFAFTDEKNAALWKPFRITPVFYPVVERDHSALVDGVARWIEIGRLEPLEIEERVSKIVTAPESQAPDRSQTDFLRQCVSKPGA